MMSKSAGILILALMLTTGAGLHGQQKVNSKTTPKAPAKAATKTVIPNTYLGDSDYKGGPIQRDRFSTLLRQGLTAHDSLGNKYNVVRFDFSYAEHKIYEDSAGNLIKVIDFMSEPYTGNMIGKDLSTDADLESDKEQILSLYQRVKPGDTVYFDHVKVTTKGPNSAMSIPDSVQIGARGIKCLIIK